MYLIEAALLWQPARVGVNNVNYHVRQSFVIINNVSPWSRAGGCSQYCGSVLYSIDADLVVDEVGEAGVVPPHPHPHLQLSVRGGEALGTLRVNVANL